MDCSFRAVMPSGVALSLKTSFHDTATPLAIPLSWRPSLWRQKQWKTIFSVAIFGHNKEDSFSAERFFSVSVVLAFSLNDIQNGLMIWQQAFIWEFTHKEKPVEIASETKSHQDERVFKGFCQYFLFNANEHELDANDSEIKSPLLLGSVEIRINFRF